MQKREGSNEEDSKQNVKFDNRTTNQDFFKTWRLKEKRRYGELPAFTAPLIFPDKKQLIKQDDLFKSRTHTDYSYKSIPKPEMVKVVEGNIKVGEGKHYLMVRLSNIHIHLYILLHENEHKLLIM